MKKLILIPALLIFLTGASTRNAQTKSFEMVKQKDTTYHPEVKIDKLDSLMKKL